jgi:hypothetical protein
MTCDEAARSLVIGGATGAIVTKTATQNQDKIKRLTSGGTTSCSLSTMSDTNYTYVRVRNPNATAAKVEIGVTQATGQGLPDVLLAAYATLPTTADERKVCISGADWGCLSSSTYESCLLTTKAPVIPARGSIWVYVGNFQATDGPVTFNLVAKVLSL